MRFFPNSRRHYSVTSSRNKTHGILNLFLPITSSSSIQGLDSKNKTLTTSVPAHAIRLPRDDSLWPSQQVGNHSSTILEPVYLNLIKYFSSLKALNKLRKLGLKNQIIAPDIS